MGTSIWVSDAVQHGGFPPDPTVEVTHAFRGGQWTATERVLRDRAGPGPVPGWVHLRAVGTFRPIKLSDAEWAGVVRSTLRTAEIESRQSVDIP